MVRMMGRLQSYAVGNPTLLKTWHLFRYVTDDKVDRLLRVFVWVLSVSSAFILFSLISNLLLSSFTVIFSYILVAASVSAVITILVLSGIVIADTISVRYYEWLHKQEDDLMFIVNRIAVRSHDDAESHYPTRQWARVPLPLERKKLLIAAGIKHVDALLPATKNLTTEDLHIMAALRGVIPEKADTPW